MKEKAKKEIKMRVLKLIHVCFIISCSVRSLPRHQRVGAQVADTKANVIAATQFVITNFNPWDIIYHCSVIHLYALLLKLKPHESNCEVLSYKFIITTYFCLRFVQQVFKEVQVTSNV